MNLYAIPPLITGIVLAIIGLFVFFNDKASRVNIIFTLFCSSMVWWLSGYTVMYLSKNPITALVWAKIGFIGVIFIPLFAYHFIATFLNLKVSRIFLTILYLLSIPSLVLSQTNYIYKGIALHFWGYYPVAGKFYIIFLIMFAALFSYGVWLLFKSLSKRDVSSLKHQQIRYVLLAFTIGTFGLVDYLVKYPAINIYPFGYICAFFFIGIIAYAIVRHHLMNIEVVIKKTVVFASLFVIVYGIFVGITLLTQELLAGGRLLGLAISSLVIILTVRPMEIFLVRATDKYLFQKKYDYKNLIKEFMDELKTMVLNMNGIAQSTVDFFMSSIRPASVAIFIYDKFTNRYDLIASSDFKDKGYKIANDSQLVRILGQRGTIIRTDSDESFKSQERNRLKAMGIELIIPLSAHKELIGLLYLGKKKSDEDYTEDDIGTLSDLSGALSISLKNAQLFDERADAEKRALVGTIATGINHEIGNPLNIITIKLETFRILAKEGMMEHKSKDEIMKEIGEITKVCLDSVQRIAEITKQVAEFAKPDRKIIFGKINVGEAIDETITILKHGMILDTGKIEKSFPHDPVYVMADRGQLKQILFNLIKNASQAIADGKGKIIVSVEKNDGGEIAIKIIDNGCGMPKEVRDKVFTPFFTTKDPGKGTGLGLALVKIMVDRNDGRIAVESQEGLGTTFTLVFKGGLL